MRGYVDADGELQPLSQLKTPSYHCTLCDSVQREYRRPVRERAVVPIYTVGLPYYLDLVAS
eukprot:COSAG01_NODE_90_length_27307_cov_734.166458_26_plen_61_part_00